MNSRIAEAIHLEHQPVALLWSDEKPAATEFQPGRWGCVMWLVAGAVRGRTGVCGRETFGCFGGGVGLGFGPQYENFPGGEACFCRFLSSGNADSEEGSRVADEIKPHMRPEAHEEFLHGERYLKNPARVEQFIRLLPITDIPARYVVFKPLAEVDPEREEPRTVVFLANPDQLSALVVLANYDAPTNENVIMPFAAGCQAIGIYPYQEAERNNPRGVVGMVDLSARLQLKKQIGDNYFTFAAPYALYRHMEEGVPGSFLERPTWQALVGGEAE